VLFDKTASVGYISFEKYIYILSLQTASQWNRHCADCIGTLLFCIAVALGNEFNGEKSSDVLSETIITELAWRELSTAAQHTCMELADT